MALFRYIAAAAVLLPAAGGAAVASHKPPPQISITIDDTAVRQLIAMANAHDASDADLEQWLDLPANQCLLAVGDQENDLTRAQLKENALEVIQGKATDASQPEMSMGDLLLDAGDYTKMLDDLEPTEPARIAQITAHDDLYSPSGVVVKETVYLHLGGDWDAINRDGDIFINIRFWHDNVRPSWDGLNLIIAHETFHSVQNAAYGNPEVQDNADGAFLTVLSKLQREGTARYVEYDADPGPYDISTYGFMARATDEERLRAFPQDIGSLEALYTACYPTFDHDAMEQAYTDGVNDGGPYYDIGNAIAQLIDRRISRNELIKTVQDGPKRFFEDYIHLCDKDHSLPPLPPDIAMQVQKMPDKLPVDLPAVKPAPGE